MAMNILAFNSSPRYGGNTETLLDAVISGMKSEGAAVEKFRLHDLDITPCTSCGNCEKEFRCPINDTFQDLVEPMVACDGIVFASPLYFMNVPARGKAFIDRCQLFWSARFLLGKKLFGNKSRCGMLISCGGRSYGPGKSTFIQRYRRYYELFFLCTRIGKKRHYSI